MLREHKLAALARLVTFDAKLRPAIVVGDVRRSAPSSTTCCRTPSSTRRVRVSVRVELAVQDDFAVLDVIDQGPGIDPVDRPHIFDSFYQGKTAPGGRIKGSGLGLAIAQEYALAHGGRVELVDRTGRRAGRALPPVAAGRGRWASPSARRQRRPAVIDRGRGMSRGRGRRGPRCTRRARAVLRHAGAGWMR